MCEDVDLIKMGQDMAQWQALVCPMKLWNLLINGITIGFSVRSLIHTASSLGSSGGTL
jgi:hypothetical protein